MTKPALGAEAAGLPVLGGLSEIRERFDAILCDIWGVLHNGAFAHPAAWQALARARSEGIAVILMSNAPRPGPAVVEELRGLGIPDEGYDGIVTSGDLTRDFLARQAEAAVLHIGPARDKILFEVELTRFRGRFVALAAQVSSCRLLSYSIGER